MIGMWINLIECKHIFSKTMNSGDDLWSSISNLFLIKNWQIEIGTREWKEEQISMTESKKKTTATTIHVYSWCVVHIFFIIYFFFPYFSFNSINLRQYRSDSFYLIYLIARVSIHIKLFIYIYKKKDFTFIWKPINILHNT